MHGETVGCQRLRIAGRFAIRKRWNRKRPGVKKRLKQAANLETKGLLFQLLDRYPTISDLDLAGPPLSVYLDDTLASMEALVDAVRPMEAGVAQQVDRSRTEAILSTVPICRATFCTRAVSCIQPDRTVHFRQAEVTSTFLLSPIYRILRALMAPRS